MKRHLLLVIGIIFSYISTAGALTYFSGRSFHFSYPIDLLEYIFRKIINFEIFDQKIWGFVVLFIVLSAIPALIFDAFLSANPFRKSKKTKYGYAKFASVRLIKKMGLNFEDGIILGMIKGNIFRKPLFIKSNNPLSTLIIAPSGTGKTAGFIIPTLLTIKNSVVALDIKGELFQKTSTQREAMGQKIMVFGLGGDLKFNPFSRNTLPQDLRRIKPFVKNINNLIFDDASRDFTKNSGSSYFANSAKELFNSLILYNIIRSGYATITDVQQILLKDEDIIKTLKRIRADIDDRIEAENNLSLELEKQDPLPENDKIDLLRECRFGINQILQISSATDQFLGVIGSLTTILSNFDDYDLRKIISCEYSSIKAEDLRNEKITLYLNVRDADMERMRPVLKWLFETFISTLISKEPSDLDNKVTFILDEFGNLGRVSKLIKATTISRSYKLNQIFILQDLSQIEAIYSKEERGILEANTAYKVILSQNNLETARRISDLIGNKTEIRTSKSEQEEGGKRSKSSYSSSYESIPLVTPQDILNLKKNECITVVQGYAANVIFAKIPWYFQNKIQ